MELWIRSQDKKMLKKVTKIYISFRKRYCDNKVETYYVLIDNEDKFLGIYSTEKQALEVLDEIQAELLATTTQELLMHTPIDPRKNWEEQLNFYKTRCDFVTKNLVYQMPEDKGEDYGR